MTTLYIVENFDGEGNQYAMEKQEEAKAKARDAHAEWATNNRVLKVELAKLPARELMCALFNGETAKFVGSKEVIYTAGVRKSRKAGADNTGEEPEATPADESNPYDI